MGMQSPVAMPKGNSAVNSLSGWAKLMLVALLAAFAAVFTQGHFQGRTEERVAAVEKIVDVACKEIDRNELVTMTNRQTLETWIRENKETLSELRTQVGILTERLAHFQETAKRLEEEVKAMNGEPYSERQSRFPSYYRGAYPPPPEQQE